MLLLGCYSGETIKKELRHEFASEKISQTIELAFSSRM